ncbi:uncharacterized protein LOC132041461 [Lycium ferocissimum]|uniref:uncharacterized protein LOC132041461 n=1 Tax=Lycium ferocissimum TaxID=112874 RepID=UPI0028162832|nr:uncharacterized protein LOC132041461 [Lycium ferocissimum]
MPSSVGGSSGVVQYSISQAGGTQSRVPDQGSFSASSLSVQRPTLDRASFECGEQGHIKRFCPRLRQDSQSGRGYTQPNRGGYQSGRGGYQSGRGGYQTVQGDREGSPASGGLAHCYAIPGRTEAEGSDAVITGTVSVCHR